MKTFALIAVSVASALLGSGCQSWDLPVESSTITMGADGSAGRIAIVYHPGGSTFPASTATLLGTELATRGFIVDVMTARQSLVFDQEIYSALVLASPVYGAEIRPPVRDFVTSHAPFTVPVFAILTGAFPDLYESNDLPALVTFLSQNGIALEAAVKIGTGWDERRIGDRISLLADEIMEE